MNFNGAITGNVHAQPLYIESGPNGPMIIVATASNKVYALHADTGTVIWSRRARSLICHMPWANSSGPAMTATRKPRASAYFNCWPTFFASG